MGSGREIMKIEIGDLVEVIEDNKNNLASASVGDKGRVTDYTEEEVFIDFFEMQMAGFRWHKNNMFGVGPLNNIFWLPIKKIKLLNKVQYFEKGKK